MRMDIAHGDGDGAEQEQRGRGVLALGFAEGGYAVADRLYPGQGSRPGREGSHDQEDHGQAAEPSGEMLVCP